MEWHASLRHKNMMRQSTPISYLSFRQQFFFSQCCRLAVNEKKWKKIIYLKKLHSSGDNNVQIGNFPIYDKIWIRDVGMKNMRKKFHSIIYLSIYSLLLIFISRIFNTFHSLAVSGLAKKIHDSLMDLFWWIFFYLQLYPWMF